MVKKDASTTRRSEVAKGRPTPLCSVARSEIPTDLFLVEREGISRGMGESFRKAGRVARKEGRAAGRYRRKGCLGETGGGVV